MPKSPRTLAAYVATALFATSVEAGQTPLMPRGTPEHEGVSSARLARIDQRYRAGIAAGEIPGAVFLIARNGRLVYHRAFGFADRSTGTPLTENTVFALASMSKPITSVALMTLVEEGRIGLDEPISRYLPEFRTLRVVTAPVGAGDHVAAGSEPLTREPTIQDALRHTAGFVYGQFGDTPLHRAYVRAGILDPQVPLPETITRLAALPLAHQPGSTFEYSVATDVLGRVIEVVSGETLDRYIARRVTEPLRMTSTGFHVPVGATFASSDSMDQLTRGRMLATMSSNPALLSGGGGLYGSAGDYLRFAQMLLNGGILDGVRILAPATIRLMIANHLAPEMPVAPNSAALLRMIAPSAAMGQGFGYGFAVRLSEGRNPLPGSVGDFYWAGSSGTYFWVDPIEHLAVVVLTAQPQPDMKVLYRQLARQLVYQALERVAPSQSDHIFERFAQTMANGAAESDHVRPRSGLAP